MYNGDTYWTIEQNKIDQIEQVNWGLGVLELISLNLFKLINLRYLGLKVVSVNQINILLYIFDILKYFFFWLIKMSKCCKHHFWHFDLNLKTVFYILE